jgi:hypothetical protein
VSYFALSSYDTASNRIDIECHSILVVSDMS